MNSFPLDPKLDLVFERKTKLTPEQLWKGWTHPETLMKWFCPRPWKVTDCRIDLRPGGEFYTFMEGPQGEKVPNEGSFLEVFPHEKLVWTNSLLKGFRPAPYNPMGFFFTATLLLQREAGGTNYKAIVRHGNPDSCQQHEKMGYQEGWGAALKQLEELNPVVP